MCSQHKSFFRERKRKEGREGERGEEEAGVVREKMTELKTTEKKNTKKKIPGELHEKYKDSIVTEIHFLD